jgi:hypothetical protein
MRTSRKREDPHLHLVVRRLGKLRHENLGDSGNSHMTLRMIESALAQFTLVGLVLLFPAETWVSLPGGLWEPFDLRLI